jgi:nicotinate-nucleotide pyrophosphorylase (carboxylating)
MYRLMYEDLVRQALREDLGGMGDVTTDSIVPANLAGKGLILTREAGVVAGLAIAREVFTQLDPAVTFEECVADGDRLKAGQPLLRIFGPARVILTGERVALNLFARMCSVATATRHVADLIASTSARVVCTRKTTPGLRLLEKYAVRMGGGSNHRFGLDDAILIKDNHVAVAGGVRQAVEQARARAGHMLKVEVEVDTLDQLREVLDLRIDAVLLDNMPPTSLREAVELVAGRVTTEASGGITLDNVLAVAQTGVDLISMGSLTHSSRQIDLSMEIT